MHIEVMWMERATQKTDAGHTNFCNEIQKARLSKSEKESRQPMFSPGKDVRAPHQKECSDQRLNVLFEKLKEMQNSSGKAFGWCHVVPQQIPSEQRQCEENESETCKTKQTVVAKQN